MQGVGTALRLSLAAAVSLGIARFAYALLLPPMRADLQWSYTVAGALNTANALGYLVGALLAPAAMRRLGDGRSLLLGSAAASLGLLATAASRDTAVLMALRGLTGVASALVFVSGGLLAARLAAGAGSRGGLLLALYYGGTGFGILLAALAVPACEALMAARGGGPAWPLAWAVLGLACAAATLALRRPVAQVPAAAPSPAAGTPAAFRWRDFVFGLLSYAGFGIGYIGYMTFVVALLREQGLPSAQVTVFYALLGAGVVASSFLWSGLLQRHRSGRPMALLNALLAVACVLPALSAAPWAVFASGLGFGAIFLQVPGATTALVRLNTPPAGWSGGIAAFTVVFALGQVIGPLWTGWLSDGAGLARGLVASAAVLGLAAVLATRQRALSPAA
ncbi:YbfB/YjiJ family MFS transporter [Aquabacterium sp. J223]|uniref:YbfB/YjiJ family MFS transporter n=1 Tax=Aquabacterium sp. J223 TaxID=2898431 RepID=UPI0021ADA57B|nr:YbfB/YjiJ family MFS transporter [Aquabacterium sp. J223]UUX96090.1 YbfB/YjiJ family MFS transporter [Aquabacterium sp. J223]